MFNAVLMQNGNLPAFAKFINWCFGCPTLLFHTISSGVINTAVCELALIWLLTGMFELNCLFSKIPLGR